MFKAGNIINLKSLSYLLSLAFVALLLSLAKHAIARTLNPSCLEDVASIGKKASSSHQVIIASVDSSGVPPTCETSFALPSQVALTFFHGGTRPRTNK